MFKKWANHSAVVGVGDVGGGGLGTQQKFTQGSSTLYPKLQPRAPRSSFVYDPYDGIGIGANIRDL